MSPETKTRNIKIESGLVGALWSIGWMFTLAFAKLIWWQAILAIVIWPYYLGMAVR